MCCNGIITFFALLIGFLALLYVAYQLYSFVKCGCGKYGPFVSSYGQIKEDILEEARKILKSSKKKLKITDLGCGSGALLIPLAKEFPEHEFIGIEWDIVPLTMGKIKSRGLKNIRFEKKDYMQTDHSDMDLIMCYVLKTTGEPLGKKLSQEIKESTIVISEMFPLYHLEQIKEITSSIYGITEKIFVYKRKSAKKSPKTTKTAPSKELKETAPKSAKKEALKKETNKKEVAPKAPASKSKEPKAKIASKAQPKKNGAKKQASTTSKKTKTTK